MAYIRLQSKRWRRLRGFRLSSGRLRRRFLAVFSRCLRRVMERVQYRRPPAGDCNCYRGSGGESRRHLVSDVVGRNAAGVRSSWGRSNSFCAEAISDCLEFIKSNSVVVDRGGCSDLGR